VRLRRQLALTGDTVIAELYEELRSYPDVCTDAPPAEIEGPGAILVPLRVRMPGDPGAGGGAPAGELSFFSTIATFGTALDITLAELAIESFFPADAHTAAVLRGEAVTTATG
jgi:hypothetical protein